MIKKTLLVDIRQTQQYAQFMGMIGWQTIKINNTYVYRKKLPLLPFSVIKILKGKRLIKIQTLKRKLKKYHPLFVKIQPFFALIPGLNFDSNPLIPSKTIWLDLTKNQKKFFN